MRMFVCFFLVLKYVSSSYVYQSKLSEVIRAEAETCLLNYENKYSYVTFVLGDYKYFGAHKGY